MNKFKIIMRQGIQFRGKVNGTFTGIKTHLFSIDLLILLIQNLIINQNLIGFQSYYFTQRFCLRIIELQYEVFASCHPLHHLQWF